MAEEPAVEGPSRQQLQDAAVGVLQEWFEGWITVDMPEDEQVQYKVVPTKLTGSGMRFTLQGGLGVPNPDSEYEVVVKVKRR